MALQFDKHAQEANLFINDLADKLGHPDERGRSGILLRSVLHSLRDTITISESFNLISQLPMFLKGLYVDNWKYAEKPERIKSVEEFKNKVKEKQDEYGEQEFDWEKSTEDLIRQVLEHLSQYITEGEAEDIISQLSAELKPLFEESLISCS